MADSEVRQKFEEVAREMFGGSMERGPYGNLLDRDSHFSDEYKFADVHAAWRTYQAAWRAAYEDGAIAMREKAARESKKEKHMKNATGHWLDSNHAQSEQIAEAIRALAISGAEAREGIL